MFLCVKVLFFSILSSFSSCSFDTQCSLLKKSNATYAIRFFSPYIAYVFLFRHNMLPVFSQIDIIRPY